MSTISTDMVVRGACLLRLGYLCGYDKALCRDVLNAFVRELMRSLRHRAKKVWGLRSVSQAHPGTVTFIQRFDAALRLNVHLHTLALDGVYLRNEDGELDFLELDEPTADEVADVTRRTVKRVRAILERHGRSVQAILGYGSDDDDEDSDPLQEEQLALASCYGAAARGTSKAMALEKAAFWTAEARRRGLVRNKSAAEHMGTWFEDWLTERRKRFTSAPRDNDAHYRTHIYPVLLDKHVADWEQADLRRLVAELDRKARDGELNWKTAQNVWGTATKMCRDAYRSKIDALRCRTDNPAEHVEGPDRGATSRQQYLYPSEALAVLDHDPVPVRWRRFIALAIYTGLRAGELRALRWRDVDLEHGSIHVHQAWDAKRKCVKPTKGRHNRRVPIEPVLRPLLDVMHGGGDELVVGNLPSECVLATELRRYVRKAGVGRAELFTKSATYKRLTWHDLRGTTATWCAVRGDEPLRIQQRLGHRSFGTTQGYIVEAENARPGFGVPFPELPAALIASDIALRNRSGGRKYARRKRPYLDEFRTAIVELSAA